MSQQAFPTPEFYNDAGLTKRELFAAMAMQGLLAFLGHDGRGDDAEKAIARTAVRQADALIAALSGREAEG